MGNRLFVKFCGVVISYFKKKGLFSINIKTFSIYDRGYTHHMMIYVCWGAVWLQENIMTAAFDKMKNKMLTQTSGKQDNYAALRYFLIKSGTVQLFVDLSEQRKTGYASRNAAAPSSHPWLQNMRFLLKELGWEQTIRFLDFCALTHHNPGRCFLKIWKKYEELAAKKPHIFYGDNIQKFMKTKVKEPIEEKPAEEEKSIKKQIEEQEMQAQKIEQAHLHETAMSLSLFGKWNKLSPREMQQMKKMLDPVGWFIGKYRRYRVYNKKELYTLYSEWKAFHDGEIE
jgi:hypothetical protein